MQNIRKSKDKKKALLHKTFALFIFLIVINTLWMLFFYDDNTLNVIYGILTPFLYCIFYLSIKKTRKRFKSKIKSYIYIPITYAFFGVSWYFFATFFIYVSDKLDGNEDEIYEANIELISEQNKGLTNINDSKNLFEKLNIKTFFLFNPNLAYPCKIAQEVEYFLTGKSNKSQLHYSKQQTNTIIIFILLFLIQMGAIYFSENIIYPRIKPQTSTKRRRERNFLEIDDVFIDENRIYEDIDLNQKKESNNFPKL